MKKFDFSNQRAEDRLKMLDIFERIRKAIFNKDYQTLDSLLRLNKAMIDINNKCLLHIDHTLQNVRDTGTPLELWLNYNIYTISNNTEHDTANYKTLEVLINNGSIIEDDNPFLYEFILYYYYAYIDVNYNSHFKTEAQTLKKYKKYLILLIGKDRYNKTILKLDIDRALENV